MCEHHQSVIFFRLPVPAHLDRRSWFPIVSNNQRAAVFLEDLWFHQEIDGTDSVYLCSHIETSFKACFNNGSCLICCNHPGGVVEGAEAHSLKCNLYFHGR